ncbi:MAG TPA: NAD-dependent succinate-semialdehyde dehydrogenase [Candidatus Eisenbacteria bacterium]|jgi:succinate-semialdehyde dehydrogenase/glutarate-semialdehyde dehydrogenase
MLGGVRSINPATGETIRDYPEHDAGEIARRLEAARAAAVAWRLTPLAGRAEALRRAAVALRERRAENARLMTAEMGKPIAAAEAEVDKCAWVCEHFAEHGAGFLAEEPVATDAARSLVRYEPLGVVLAVMPWNFPFWQVFRCAAPALVAGNAVALKHASNVPGSALAIEDVFRAAGLPEGAFTTLLVPSAAVEGLIAHRAIAAVSLTGSEKAGAAVAAAAGRAIKKAVLELGGSDPFVVLADADPDKVADHAVAARTVNNGESCIAAKRFIVEERVADRFESALVAAMQGLKVGDPLDRSVALGPMARNDLRRELHDQVERTVAAGATLRLGGAIPGGRGYFYPATVLTGVEPGMAAFDEETFGPVAAVTRARDAADAVRLANLSRFGLGASLWTSDPARGAALAAEIEAGMVFVNGIVKSDPRLPFGGIKRSGYGRELARHGIREFVNVKTVWVG